MNNNDRFVNEALIKITKNLSLDDSKINILINTLYDCVRDYNINFINRESGSLLNYLDLYSQFMQLSNISKNTIKNYIYTLKQLDKFLNKNVQDINIFDLRLFLAHKKEVEKIKDNTLNNIINKIKSFFNFLFDEGYIDVNPVKKLKKIKEPKRIKKALSTIDLEKIRQCCKSSRDRAIVEFAFATGLRVSEIVSVDIKHLNMNTNTLKVVGKGDKERTVIFSDRTKYYLEKYLKERKGHSEALFVSSRFPFTRIGSRAIEKTIKKIKEKADIDIPVTPHTFRRTMATTMLRSGADITSVQQLLGHTNLNTTLVYLDLDFDDVMYQYNKCMGL